MIKMSGLSLLRYQHSFMVQMQVAQPCRDCILMGGSEACACIRQYGITCSGVGEEQLMYLRGGLVVSGYSDIVEGGVGAHGEEVDTCVNLLQWAKVVKG